jgi:thiol-disulfide isomerase/thioredoxin
MSNFWRQAWPVDSNLPRDAPFAPPAFTHLETFMLTRLPVRHRALLVAVAIGLGLGISAAHRTAAHAGQTDKDQQEEVNLEPFDVPEGHADALFSYLQDLLGEEKEFESEKEQRDYLFRVMATQIAVADKILKSDELADDAAEKAAQLKLQGQVNLGVLGAPRAKAAAIALVRELANDQREAVSQFAKNNEQIVKIICIAGLAPKDRDALMTDLLDELAKRKFAQRVLKRAQMLGEALEESGDMDRLFEYYGKLAKLMSESGIENLVGQAKRIEGQLRRLKLPGNVIEIEGTTLAGEKFDWKSYRGKVVLVDYWATWCGPCRAELPNVKKNYKKYHGKGFEVVGISLDEDQAELEEFLKEQKIPWVTLFEPEAENRGWENPLAVKYGVNGIPLAILVDQEGKVVSMSARGAELTRLLEELLGDKE